MICKLAMNKSYRQAAGILLPLILLITCTSQQDIDKKGPYGAGVVKIGAIFAETGPASFIGVAEANTVRMLVDDINEHGGINGHRIELLIRDSQSNSGMVYELGRELIGEGVVGIVGPSTSGASMRIKDLCEQNETVLLSCGAASAIVNPVSPFIFKMPPDSTSAVHTILETMQEMQFIKIGVLAVNNGFAGAWVNLLSEFAPMYEIEIAYVKEYDFFETEFDFMEELSGKGFHAVVNAASGPVQAIATKAFKKAGIDIPLFQSEAFADSYYIHTAGIAGEGVIFPGTAMAAAESLPDTDSQKSVITKYKKMYREEYETDTNMFGAHAYDALMLLVQAIENVGTDRRRIREEIEKTRGFVGVGGIYSFSSTNHNGHEENPYRAIRVSNGQFVVWSPSNGQQETGFAEIQDSAYKPVVAVMDFELENMSDSAGALIVDYLTNAIAQTGKFYVVAKDQRENLINEIKFSYSGLAEESTKLEMGKMLAAGKIVVGSLGELDSKYIINVQLIDVETAVTIITSSHAYDSVDDLLDGCREIAGEISPDQ